MPKKVQPSHPFGNRLTELRKARGLTQIALAEMIGSTQRAISSYETVIALPPTPVVIALAKALEVSADVLLGLETKAQQKADVPREDTETRRLWRRFQPLLSLPERDRRAVFRLVSSLLMAKRGRSAALGSWRGFVRLSNRCDRPVADGSRTPDPETHPDSKMWNDVLCIEETQLDLRGLRSWLDALSRRREKQSGVTAAGGECLDVVEEQGGPKVRGNQRVPSSPLVCRKKRNCR